MAETPLWKPSPERIEEANLTRFARQAIRDWKLGFNDYPAFYRWTIEHPEQFWDSLWKFASVRASAKGTRVLVNADGRGEGIAAELPGALFNEPDSDFFAGIAPLAGALQGVEDADVRGIEIEGDCHRGSAAVERLKS